MIWIQQLAMETMRGKRTVQFFILIAVFAVCLVESAEANEGYDEVMSEFMQFARIQLSESEWKLAQVSLFTIVMIPSITKVKWPFRNLSKIHE